jgi:hypothetical protein
VAQRLLGSVLSSLFYASSNLDNIFLNGGQLFHRKVAEEFIFIIESELQLRPVPVCPTVTQRSILRHLVRIVLIPILEGIDKSRRRHVDTNESTRQPWSFVIHILRPRGINSFPYLLARLVLFGACIDLLPCPFRSISSPTTPRASPLEIIPMSNPEPALGTTIFIGLCILFECLCQCRMGGGEHLP